MDDSTRFILVFNVVVSVATVFNCVFKVVVSVATVFNCVLRVVVSVATVVKELLVMVFQPCRSVLMRPVAAPVRTLFEISVVRLDAIVVVSVATVLSCVFNVVVSVATVFNEVLKEVVSVATVVNELRVIVFQP